MAEKWFCLVDIKYCEEDTYIPRHNKVILHVESFNEAMKWLIDYYGDNFEEVNMRWAGKPNQECRQELVFSESEFYKYELVRRIIEDDHSYEDYCKAEAEYKKKLKGEL